MGHGGENSEIVRTINTLAQNLGMEVVAEDVETAEQLAQLKSGMYPGSGLSILTPPECKRSRCFHSGLSDLPSLRSN